MAITTKGIRRILSAKGYPSVWMLKTIDSLDAVISPGYLSALYDTDEDGFNPKVDDTIIVIQSSTYSTSFRQYYLRVTGVTDGTVTVEGDTSRSIDTSILSSITSIQANYESLATRVADLEANTQVTQPDTNAGTVRFGRSTYSVNDAGGTGVISIVRAGATTGAPGAIGFSLTAGVGATGLVAGTDFKLYENGVEITYPDTLEIVAGATLKLLTFSAITDNTGDKDITLTLADFTLDSASDATREGSILVSTVTIVDAVSTSTAATLGFSPTTGSVSEAGGTYDMTVLRGGYTTTALRADWTCSDGTSGTVTIAGGAMTGTITRTLTNDGIAAGNRVYTYTLSNPIVTSGTGTVTLTNNNPFTLTVTDAQSASASTYYVSTTATGSGDGLTQGNAWTWSQAAANAVAGDTVIFLPGTYVLTSVYTDYAGAGELRFTSAFLPTNSGTVGNLITFKAQYDAATLSDTSPNRTILTTDGIYTCPVLGTLNKDYIQYRGFFINEANAAPTPDSGTITLCYTTGSQALYNRCIGIDASLGTNYNAIRIENTTDVVASYNKINNYSPSVPHANNSGIMVYASQNYTVQNNYVYDNGGGIFAKGDNPTIPAYIYNPASIKYNKIINTPFCLALGGVKPETGSQYCDVVQNVCQAPSGYAALQIEIYDAVSPNYFRVFNNTFSGNNGEGIIYIVNTGATSFDSSTLQNNIFANSANGPTALSYQTTTTEILRAVWQYNCHTTAASTIVSMSDGSYTLTTWQAAGKGTGSIQADPLFVSATDFRISDSAHSIGSGDSPCLATGIDALQLLGGATTDPINMGAYITAGQTDSIGVA